MWLAFHHAIVFAYRIIIIILNYSSYLWYYRFDMIEKYIVGVHFINKVSNMVLTKYVIFIVICCLM